MKFLYKKRDRNNIKDYKITQEDIKKAKTILFSIFGRYGDSIIGFAGSLEFIEKHPNKNYIFITSLQNYPYMHDKTKKMKNVKIFTLKKDNIFKLLYILSYLKLNKPDLGFNPFCWNSESEFLISFAKKYNFYENNNFTFESNYYDRVREYFKLSIQNFKILSLKNKKHTNILICPESSEKRRSLSDKHIKFLLQKHKNSNIILAVNEKKDFEVNQFIFSKKNSDKFLQIVKNSDLIICVDSAPLHIGMLYDKDIMLFLSIKPAINIVNTNKHILVIRNYILENIICEDKECEEAKCLDFYMKSNKYYNKVDKNIKILKRCILKEENE